MVVTVAAAAMAAAARAANVGGKRRRLRWRSRRRTLARAWHTQAVSTGTIVRVRQAFEWERAPFDATKSSRRYLPFAKNSHRPSHAARGPGTAAVHVVGRRYWPYCTSAAGCAHPGVSFRKKVLAVPCQLRHSESDCRRCPRRWMERRRRAALRAGQRAAGRSMVAAYIVCTRFDDGQLGRAVSKLGRVGSSWDAMSPVRVVDSALTAGRTARA